MFIENRPWGNFIILFEDDNCKVKKITIFPEKRISLQKHFKRNEHWYIVNGNAYIINGEDSYFACDGKNIDIIKNSWHRIENVGKNDLIFIEVQTGEYFGEDDIERKEDDFGRF